MLCGDGMVLLGVVLDALHQQRVRCPKLKREAVTFATRTVREKQVLHRESTSMLCSDLQDGRLKNRTQYFPELRRPLSVGYSLSRSEWAFLRRRGRTGIRWILLQLCDFQRVGVVILFVWSLLSRRSSAAEPRLLPFIFV